MQTILKWFYPVETMPAWQFYLRLLGIAIMIVLSYCLAEQNNPFFYQAF